MRKLNKKATGVFCQLLKKMDGKNHLRMELSGFMPLVIEFLYETIETPWGMAKKFSLSHYFKLNGDTCADPDMGFLVVDNRTQEVQALEMIGIYPFHIQLDQFSSYVECLVIEHNKLVSYRPYAYKAQREFANAWMIQILQHGYLDVEPVSLDDEEENC